MENSCLRGSSDDHGVVSQGKMKLHWHPRHETDTTKHATHSHLQDRAARRTCRFVQFEIGEIPFQNHNVLKKSVDSGQISRHVDQMSKPTRSARRSVLKMTVCDVFGCVHFMSSMVIRFHFSLGNDAMIVSRRLRSRPKLHSPNHVAFFSTVSVFRSV